MSSYQNLIKGNEEWVKEKLSLNPEYFTELAKGQQPEFLWIGCSDSRVPANEITKTASGDIFVHRNIANQVLHSDMNMLSVVQYAVQYLKVKHVIVCGHYGCGGVKAAIETDHLGLVGHWISGIKDIYQNNKTELDKIGNDKDRENKVVELNVKQQVHNLAKISFIQQAWKSRELQIHGWVYSLGEGKIKELDCNISGTDQLEKVYGFTGLD